MSFELEVEVGGRHGLPEHVHAGSGVVAWLVDVGVWPRLADRVRLSRRGGYAGIDAVLFLVLFFSQKTKQSLRGFYASVLGREVKLGALGGRLRLMSPSSLSRLLGRARLVEVLAFARELLWGAGQVEALHRRPDVVLQDRQEQPWHVLFFDPTSFVLRERALPEGEELPKAQRDQEGFSSPGYSGRKRGENTVRLGALSHGGSAAWLDLSLAKGDGGDTAAQFRQAVAAVRAFADQVGHPASRVLLCADGEFGGVPYLDVCVAHGVPVLTRCISTAVLNEPEVRRNLETAVWRPVADSGSGPQRWAADLGTVKLFPSHGPVRPDGTPVEPITVRLIAARYTPTSDRGRGVQLGATRLELFVAWSVPEEAFSADDLVHLYYARCGQENQFARLDAEYRIKRVYSYSLGGQLLCVLVAAALWNIDLFIGQSAQAPSPGLPLDTVPRGAPPEPLVMPVDEPEEPSPRPHPEAPVVPVIERLQALDWHHILRRRPGWRWNPERGVLVDPDGLIFRLNWLQVRSWGAVELRFATLGDNPDVATPSFSIPQELGLPIVQSWREGRRQERHARRRAQKQNRRPTGGRRHEYLGDPAESPPAPPHLPGFRPADARRIGRAATGSAQADIALLGPMRPIPREPSRHDRAHRRLSWTQHRDRYATTTAVHVLIRVSEPHPLARGCRPRA